MVLTAQAGGTLSALPVERRALAAGVHMIPVEEDVVVLDLRSDAYACLPHAAHQLRIVEGIIEADVVVLGFLADADLLDGAPGRPSRPIPKLPTRLFKHRPGVASIPAVAHLIAAARVANRLGVNAPVQALIEALPRRPAPGFHPARVEAVTAAFTRLLPWVPDQGACLYRAFVLLFMLRRAGADAVWVFGVRTWPFSAHCWLQVGETVLDDDPERVSRYTPIMAL